MNKDQFQEIIIWDDVPETLSKEQFYKLCHISKSTALHLLKSGIVPSVNTGRKTHCYQIKREDVKEYLEKRAIFPESFSAPSGWYCNKKTKTSKRVPPKILEDMTMFYIEKLKNYPSILTAAQVCSFTGYRSSSVTRWCRIHYLKAFSLEKLHIPKVCLIEFMNSNHFRSINKKSEKHISLLFEYRVWQDQNDNNSI